MGDRCTGVCCFNKGKLPSQYEGELGTHWIDGAALTIKQAQDMGTYNEELKETLKVQETDDELYEWQRAHLHKKCQKTMQWTEHMRSSKALKATTLRGSQNQQVDHAAITATKFLMTVASHGGYRNLSQPQLIALRDTTHPGALPLQVNEMHELVNFNWYHVLPKERRREVMIVLAFVRGGEIAAKIEAAGEGADTSELKTAFEETTFYTPHLRTTDGKEIRHKLEYNKHGAILARLYRDLMAPATSHNTLSRVFKVCTTLFKAPLLWAAYQPKFAVRSAKPLLAADFQRTYCTTEPVRPTSQELGLLSTVRRCDFRSRRKLRRVWARHPMSSPPRIRCGPRHHSRCFRARSTAVR